ncbi:MAG TPA: VTT domain-containing protein [Vicinamibacterales bacterium]|nr:VTT domain-containing protein [Vicinamibacterales bacterium]
MFARVFGTFASASGVLFLGILDSTLVFFLPLGIDAVVILMAARNSELAWLYPVLATLGSVLGSALTYWVGHKIGEHGLSRFVPAARLQLVRRQLKRHGAFTVAALALIPPPFPFTPFVLVSGALHFSRLRLFPMLALARLLRFGLEAALAVKYGDALVGWMTSDTFKIAVGVFIVITTIGTIVSALVVVRRARALRD